MRTIALIALFLFPLTVAAQKDAIYDNSPSNESSKGIQLPENNRGEIEYSGVIKVDSSTGLQLYERAQNFLIHEFVSKKAVTQLDDKDERRIIVKGNFDVAIAPSLLMIELQPIVYMIFEIQCKDGRYRYIINQFEYQIPGAANAYSFSVTNKRQTGHGIGKSKWDKLLSNIDLQVKSIISDMTSSMAANSRSNDW